MSKENTDEMKEFDKKMDKLIDEYQRSPEYKSDNYLYAAYDEENESKKKKLAKQALEIYPDNIDAQILLATFEKDMIKRLKLYDNIIDNATKILEKENMFDEKNIGHFWGIMETRPYMRAKCCKMNLLFDLSRYKEAIKECEDLIRLCPNDNMGIRYRLLGLYALIEDFDKVEYLFNGYGKEESTYMLFIMAISYYKQGMYSKAKKYIKLTNEANKYVYYLMFKGCNKDNSKYYSRGSSSEAIMIINDLDPLILSSKSFIEFAKKVLDIL